MYTVSEYPLLPMPQPMSGELPKNQPFPRKPMKLSPRQQHARLGTKFEHLSNILAHDGEGLSLREDPSSIAPERALVLEVAESIENFSALVSNVEGLEYLADEDFEFEPEEGFAPADTRVDHQGEFRLDKPIAGKVYIAMPSIDALKKLLRLWKTWQTEHQFQRGSTAWRSLFESLHDIRPWDIRDRIADNAINHWQSAPLDGHTSMKRVEVDLWYFESTQKREVKFREFRQRIQEIGGVVISHSVINEIRYNGVLVDVPLPELTNLMQRAETRFTTCDSIMYICPQSTVDTGQVSQESVLKSSIENLQEPGGPPIAALLDSVPVQNHDLLVNRIDFNDPDNLESMSLSGARNHSTEMASVIIHGDLNEKHYPISRVLYIHPVMYSPTGQTNDIVVDDRLFVDTVYRAILRMKDGDSNNLPTAPSIFIVNFSIGINTRPFAGHVSPLARLLDYLAERYNILFLVSAGNVKGLLEVKEISKWTQFESATPEQRQRIVLRALNESKAFRTLLSPAEALNVITVGSWHEDQTTALPGPMSVSPYVNSGAPNISSALGLGYKRVIKPDIHMPGGREFLRARASTSSSLRMLPSRLGCGLSCATGDPDASGSLDRTGLVAGTSAATALATHAAHRLYEAITDSDHGLLYSNIDPQFYAVVIKALLIHRARWGNVAVEFENLTGPFGPGTYVQRRDNVARFMGYGLALVSEAESCDPHRATLVGCGIIPANGVDIHRVPLPICLSKTSGYRALTVTVAWMSPVNFGHQMYRRVRLTIDPIDRLDNSVGVKRSRIQPSDKSVPRGTVFHCRYEGEQVVSFIDGSHVSFRIICKPQAGGVDEAIRYGIAVSLEASEEIPVYQEVRSRLAISVTPSQEQ